MNDDAGHLRINFNQHFLEGWKVRGAWTWWCSWPVLVRKYQYSKEMAAVIEAFMRKALAESLEVR